VGGTRSQTLSTKQWTNAYTKQQRLRAGAEQQANFPEELLAPSRDWESQKDWE
jgi:hypothetical protein